MVKILEHQKFGSNINTQMRQFPFASKDGKLYFSSDGHAGYGSLDVVDLKGDNFDLPSNVGLPVNATIFI
jgi:hypothetical protein